MARAKSTTRADARRRYRATQAGPVEELEPNRLRDDASAPPEATPQRRSLFSGLSRIDWRGDIALFPTILRTSRIVWLGILALVATAAIAIADPQIFAKDATGYGPVVAYVVGLALLQPPSVVVLVVGLFTPRAAWLVGGFLGFVQALLAAVVSVTVGSALGSTAATAAVGLPILSLVVELTALGALFGGLASWYRRFLRETGERNRLVREERERQKRRAAKASAPRTARPTR